MRRLTFASLAILAGLAGPAFGQGLDDVRAGNEAFKDGRFADAVAAYSRVIDAGTIEGEALAITRNNRGVAYGEMGRYDVAIDDYKASLVLRPDDMTTIKNLRVAYTRRGRERSNADDYAGAQSDYDAAIRLDPGHYLAWLRRGELEEKQGEVEAALADYAEAKKRSPDNDEISQAIGRAHGQTASLGGEGTPAKADPKAPVKGSEVPAASPETAKAEAPPPSSDGPAVARDEAPPTRPTTPPAAETPNAVASRTAKPDVEPAAAPAAPVRSGASSASADTGSPEGRWRAKEAVNVRVGPDNGADPLGVINRGVEVEVIGDRLGWKHVILPSGQEGYIYKRWLEPIGG